jgi:hypothetical protein
VSDTAPDLRAAALELLRQASSSIEAALPSVEQVLEPAYWRELVPSLAIDGAADSTAVEEREIGVDEQAELEQRLDRRGYVRTGTTLSRETLARLAAAAEQLRSHNLPPAFVALYDEVWLLPRSPSLRRLVGSQLGADYAQIPNVWCHYVAPVRKTSGWPPHCDGYGRDDRGGRFTLHVPLTEATLENGCMYLVPRDLLPPGIAVGDADTRTVLQASRALPAAPGEVLGWSFDILHWGSASSGDGTEPRVSLSYEFIAADATPVPDETPLVAMEGLPPFTDRLRFLSLGVLRYAQFEPRLGMYEELARGVLDRLETS